MTGHHNARPAPTTPPMIASEESTEEQLQLGRKEWTRSRAQTTRAGEYEVVVVVENAEGMWSFEDGELRWMNPTDENAHVEVAVCDRADGRFIPGLQVQVTISAADGSQVGTHEQPFLWRPWLYHYGRNWRIPGEGDYRIHVRIEAPTFHRHDHNNGRRYAQAVEVDFDRRIKPGQKKA